MGLPNSYTVKTGAIAAYFDAIQSAEAPERFSIKFLQNLGFSSSNDRLIIGILKDLGLLDDDGVPQERYYEYLDKNRSTQILADGIKESYSDLFAVNKEANKLNYDDTYNKLRTLYKGAKKDSVIKLISKTFVALCELANFSKSKVAIPKKETGKSKEEDKSDEKKNAGISNIDTKDISLDSLQYHINIVLPETRDPAIYDAIFKSLRDHLG